MKNDFLIKVLITAFMLLILSNPAFAGDWSSIKTNGIPYEVPEGVFLDNEDNPWITGSQSGEGGIYYWPQGGTGVWYTCENTGGNIPKDAYVNFFMQDSACNKWYSVWSYGLLCRKGNGDWIRFNTDSSPIVFSNYFLGLKELSDGYWATTTQSVFKISKDFNINNDNYYVYTDTYINDFLEDSSGVKWLLTSGSGIYTNINEKGYLEPINDAFDDVHAPSSSRIFTKVIEDTGGNIWFTTNTSDDTGIYEYTKDGNWRHYTKEDIGNLNRYGINNAIVNEDNGDIWFGVLYGGLLKYDGAEFTSYTKEDLGLQSGDVGSMDFDSNGNLWFVTGSEAGAGMGVNKMTFDNGDFNVTSYNHKNTSTTLTSNRIWDVAVDKNDGVWFGSNGDGLSYRDPDGNWHQFHSYMDNSYLGSDYVNGIDVDSQNRVYFQFWGGGYSYYDVDNDTWHRLESPYRMDAAYDVYIDSEDGKWFCHSNGLLYLNADNSEWTLYNNSNTNGGLPHDIVYCAFKDSKGNTWVGTRNGLGRLNTDGSWNTYVYNYGAGEDFQISQVESIAESQDGIIYVQGSSMVQAYDYDTGSWTTPKVNNDIPYGSYVKKMPNGDMWFGTGILRTDGTFERYNQDNTDKAIPYNGEIYVKDIACDSEGNVYFAFLDSGVTVYSGEDFGGSTGSRPDDSQYVLWTGNNATDDIDQMKPWTISFSKSLDEGTVTENNIFVYNKNESTPHSITLGIVDGSKITVTPNSPYLSGGEYTLYISKDIKSSDGKSLAQGIRMDFSIKSAG